MKKKLNPPVYMMPEDFAVLADSLFGRAGQRELISTYMGVDVSTIRRWRSGDVAIPKSAVILIQALALLKLNGLPMPEVPVALNNARYVPEPPLRNRVATGYVRAIDWSSPGGKKSGE